MATRKPLNESDLLEQIKEHPPEIVYAGLLFFAIMRHYKAGWAVYAFKELYGFFPPDQTVRPLDCRNTVLEEWCWFRKRTRGN